MRTLIRASEAITFSPLGVSEGGLDQKVQLDGCSPAGRASSAGRGDAHDHVSDAVRVLRAPHEVVVGQNVPMAHAYFRRGGCTYKRPTLEGPTVLDPGTVMGFPGTAE